LISWRFGESHSSHHHEAIDLILSLAWPIRFLAIEMEKGKTKIQVQLEKVTFLCVSSVLVKKRNCVCVSWRLNPGPGKC
jgi:hypothetical protein